jgi:hypothetical protein
MEFSRIRLRRGTECGDRVPLGAQLHRSATGITKVQDKGRSTEQELVMSELTYEELLCVQSFLARYNETRPEVIATETTAFSEIHGYAGTVDFICRIGGVPMRILPLVGSQPEAKPETKQRKWHKKHAKGRKLQEDIEVDNQKRKSSRHPETDRIEAMLKEGLSVAAILEKIDASAPTIYTIKARLKRDGELRV